MAEADLLPGRRPNMLGLFAEVFLCFSLSPYSVASPNSYLGSNSYLRSYNSNVFIKTRKQQALDSSLGEKRRIEEELDSSRKEWEARMNTLQGEAKSSGPDEEQELQRLSTNLSGAGKVMKPRSVISFTELELRLPCATSG